MLTSKHTMGIALDKREANVEIKRQIGESWKLKFLFSDKMEIIKATFQEIGNRDCFEEKDRAKFS